MTPTQTGRIAMGRAPSKSMIHDLASIQLASGTTVLTLDGEMPVEFLSPGDRVITRDTGMSRISHVSHIFESVRAIEIQGGSLGDMRPETDMIIPENQMIMIRDWRAQALFNTRQAVVPASDLIDGEFIRDIGQRGLSLTRLHFERPHVIYAGGLELATTLPSPGQAKAA